MALGAQQWAVRGMFLRHGLLLTALGIILGLSVALGLSRLMSSLIFGISTLDRVTFCTVPVVLAAVAMTACYLPARRASSVDPIEALRWE